MNTVFIGKLLSSENREDANIAASLIENEADVVEYLWIANILFALGFYDGRYNTTVMLPLLAIFPKSEDEIFHIDHILEYTLSEIGEIRNEKQITNYIKELEWTQI